MSHDNGAGVTLHSNGEDFAVETSPGAFVPKIDTVTMKPTGEAQRFQLAPSPVAHSGPMIGFNALSDNGTAHVAADMREPVRPLKAAELSSQERNKLVDALVEVVNNHALVLSEHRRMMEGHRRDIDVLRGENHANAVRWERSFWQRLRWIVSGK